MNEKSHVSLEKSKQYFDSAYSEQSTATRLPINGKRAFAVKRSKFHVFIDGEPLEMHSTSNEPEEIIENDIDISKINLPDFPKMKVSEQRKQKPTKQDNSGAILLDRNSQNMETCAKLLNRQATEILKTIEKLESVSIDCVHYAEYSKVLSNSTMRQLNQIATMNDHGNVFIKIYNYLKSYVPFK